MTQRNPEFHTGSRPGLDSGKPVDGLQGKKAPLQRVHGITCLSGQKPKPESVSPAEPTFSQLFGQYLQTEEGSLEARELMDRLIAMKQG